MEVDRLNSLLTDRPVEYASVGAGIQAMLHYMHCVRKSSLSVLLGNDEAHDLLEATRKRGNIEVEEEVEEALDPATDVKCNAFLVLCAAVVENGIAVGPYRLAEILPESSLYWEKPVIAVRLDGKAIVGVRLFEMHDLANTIPVGKLPKMKALIGGKR